MWAGRAPMTGLRIIAVCLVFAACFAVGGALSGLTNIGQQAPPARPAIAAEPEVAAKPQALTPENLLLTFLFFSICPGMAPSYLILRSSWHGWSLAGAVGAGMGGISTVVTQIESVLWRLRCLAASPQCDDALERGTAPFLGDPCFDLVFGTLAGWLLSPAGRAAAADATAAC